MLTLQHSAIAVNFDPDRYGDKELKVATINKITQKIRNELGKDLSLLVPLFQLSLADALSYQKSDGSGGIDGSILYELDRPSSAGLQKAAALIENCHAELARTTEISYADIIAFGGASAIEVIGGPKVKVQIGRADTKEAEPEAARAGFSWQSPTLDGLRKLGKGCDLSGAELVALVGTLGTLELAARPMPEFLSAEEDDEDIDPDGKAAAAEVGGGYADTMYGKAKNKAGSKFGDANYLRDQKLSVDVRVQKIGNQAFDTTYFASLLDKKRAAPLSPLESAILADKELKKSVEEFSKSKQKFRETVRSTYGRLQVLGGNYVGAASFLDDSN